MSDPLSTNNKKVRVRIADLGRLFPDTGVSPSNDNDLPGQVRDIVDGELALWSEVSVKYPIELLSEDAEGGENASAKHVWRGTAQEENFGSDTVKLGTRRMT